MKPIGYKYDEPFRIGIPTLNVALNHMTFKVTWLRDSVGVSHSLL